MLVKGLEVTCVHSLGKDGALCRFPEEINERLGHDIAFHMYGQEIRFRPLETVYLTLSCLEPFPENKVEIYYGDHLLPHEISFQDQVRIRIDPISRFVDEKLIGFFRSDRDYAEDLVRVVLLGKRIRIDAVEGRFELPSKDDVPKKNILVYGTSLSQGTASHVASLSYPSLLGRKLHMNVDNYALAGQCLLEDFVIDFLCSLDKCYDLILFEPSTNLLAQGFTEDAFKEKVNYALRRFRGSYPDARVACIDLFESIFDHGVYGPFRLAAAAEGYRKALEETATAFHDDHILFVHAGDLIDPRDFSIDMMHPTSLGYYEIASRLYEKIKKEGLFNESDHM